MKKEIGGQRIGSGSNMDVELHSYSRSTHDLSETWRSSMAPGLLVPFYCSPAVNGDTFDIDLNASVMTLPTIAPLFGSYKLQLDVYQVPARLYNALLHNNALNVGNDMHSVEFPKITLEHDCSADYLMPDYNNSQISSSHILKYLGLSGIGVPRVDDNDTTIERTFNAVPLLAYLDIFKNYYANKQEDNFYYICGTFTQNKLSTILGRDSLNVDHDYQASYNSTNNWYDVSLDATTITYRWFMFNKYMTIDNVFVVFDNDIVINPYLTLYKAFKYDLRYLSEIGVLESLSFNDLSSLGNNEGSYIDFKFRQDLLTLSGVTPTLCAFYFANPLAYEPYLQDDPLSTLDDLRQEILSSGGVFDCANQVSSNYIFEVVNSTKYGTSRVPMMGLICKTYQSDVLNNWINTDWIDGPAGISAVTAVSIANNALNLDALNLAQKVYNMLNRIAVSGGSYSDWQEAVYGESVIRHAESPIYLGGMKSEISFNEVVTTAETKVGNNYSPAGSLVGKGQLFGKKGGHIHVNINEPSFIIGIVSITPRISYHQGNAWYLTELLNYGDLHAPALDGIGFEDSINERRAWFDTIVQDNAPKIIRRAAGKVPAWINYMTSVDKNFGTFAQNLSDSYMVLDRNYESNIYYDSNLMRYDYTNGIKDLSTYIDPSKFNYAFAKTDLSAQNFWVQIHSDVKARRKMSAKIIPNL